MIRILDPGLYSSIQDLGRLNYEHFGVPISGCMDLQSSSLANKLLNNPKESALIESTQIGPKILFKISTIISITGANMTPSINNKLILMNKAINIKKGDILSFNNSKNGLRCYIGINGGIKSDLILGSRSCFKGISQNIKLKKGDVLKINSLKKRLNSSSKMNISYIYDNKKKTA